MSADHGKPLEDEGRSAAEVFDAISARWAAEDAAMAAQRARALKVAKFVVLREDATEREDLLARVLIEEHQRVEELKAQLLALGGRS